MGLLEMVCGKHIQLKNLMMCKFGN